jgi:predicted esterase
MILAGHDMGAEVAIWLALTGVLPTSGFIGIAPHGPLMTDIEKWQPYIESVQSRLESQVQAFRGEILLGEEDQSASIDNINIFVDMLNSTGILCELTMIQTAAHELSPEFEEPLSNALANFFPE